MRLGDGTPFRRILLVGFMGSGKTRVGQLLARRLGWEFRDFDAEIRSRMGLPIPEIFRQHGEDRFREMEGHVGAELLRNEEVVLASGGGWPSALGRMETLPEGTLSVWLQVTPEEAVRRAHQEGPTRPLLAVDDPVGKAREILKAREESYCKADLRVDTAEGSPEELARRIEDMMKDAGWPQESAPPGVG
jgi:shikimate kinase